jgi:cell division protein FtsX
MDIADIMIHLHPDLSVEQRANIEEEVAACEGVVSVHFSPQHAHEMTVAYDPETIDSQTILAQVRQWDAAATMVGL